MKRFFALLSVCILGLTGCKSTATLLPSVSGKAGEVIIVMDRENWEGSLGADTR